MSLTILPDLMQGTEEWLEQRRGMVTASVVGRLLTPTLKVASNETSRGLAHSLTAERITGHVDSTYASPDMWRGHEEEPLARDAYAQHRGVEVQEVGLMVRDDWGFRIGYSPDGLVGDDGLIEVKSRLQKHHLAHVLVPHGMPRFRNLGDFLPPGMDSASNAAAFLAAQMDTSLTWEDVRRLRELWPRRLLVKGVLLPEDALRAKEAGADGVVVTNHGGRQLDAAPAPIETLAAVRQAVGAEMTVIVDSGFRRGSDFVKARALGADAAMAGRATLYGLAAAGAPGAASALEILRSEMERTLGLIGCARMAEVDARFVGRG